MTNHTVPTFQLFVGSRLMGLLRCAPLQQLRVTLALKGYSSNLTKFLFELVCSTRGDKGRRNPRVQAVVAGGAETTRGGEGGQ